MANNAKIPRGFDPHPNLSNNDHNLGDLNIDNRFLVNNKVNMNGKSKAMSEDRAPEVVISSEPDKLEPKLRSEASEFDGLSGYDPHININPYAHPLGVSTCPEYVSPAEIQAKLPPTGSKTTNASIVPTNPTLGPQAHRPLHSHQPQQFNNERVVPTRVPQVSYLQGYPPERYEVHPHMAHEQELSREAVGSKRSEQMSTGIHVSSHGMGNKLADPNRNLNVGGMRPPVPLGHEFRGYYANGQGIMEQTMTETSRSEEMRWHAGSPGMATRSNGMIGFANDGRHLVVHSMQEGYESGHSQGSDGIEQVQSKQATITQGMYPVHGKREGTMDAMQTTGRVARISVQSPFGVTMRAQVHNKTKSYQPYKEENENPSTVPYPQAMKDYLEMGPLQYPHWKPETRDPKTFGLGQTSYHAPLSINGTNEMPGADAPHIGTLNGLNPSPVEVLPAVPQSGHNSVSRNYGIPKPEDIDPEFTNEPDLVRYQRWELLESAKRWLPGEGTVLTWKGFCYVIGASIHMGMNGHVHYCYRYKLPPSKDQTSKVGENYSQDANEPSNHKETLPNVFSKKDVATVAAKIVPNTSAFAREIVVLRDLQGCENVTILYDVLESKRTLISILELAKSDVYHFFVGREASVHGWSLEKPAVREAFARMVVTNAVQGLKQMHDKEYLHCDLKSLNVLLYIYKNQSARRQGGVYMNAKLTDFGHSSKGKTRTADATFRNGMARVGTAGHVAPELFKEGAICDSKIDIWSLGIVMFSMLVPGKLLFGEYTQLKTLKKAYDALNKMNPWSTQRRPKWWADFERLSPEARDLILWMTRFNPDERPNGDQIMKHPWFQISMGNLKPGQYRPKLKYVDMLCSSSIAQE